MRDLQSYGNVKGPNWHKCKVSITMDVIINGYIYRYSVKMDLTVQINKPQKWHKLERDWVQTIYEYINLLNGEK